MTNYTIINKSGIVVATDATAAQVARGLLGHDGHEWEIRRADGGGFDLWISNFSRNSSCFNGLTRSVIFSLKNNETEAEADIFQRVVDSGFWSGLDYMSDADYAQMLAEGEADE